MSRKPFNDGHDAMQKGKLRSKSHFCDIWFNTNVNDEPNFPDCLVMAVDVYNTSYCIVSWDREKKIGFDEVLEKGSCRLRIKEEVPRKLVMAVAEEMKKGELTIEEIKEEFVYGDKPVYPLDADNVDLEELSERK